MAEAVGSPVEVTCEDDLEAEKDAKITCELTEPSSDQTYDMTAVVTSVDGSDVNMEIEVLEPPA